MIDRLRAVPPAAQVAAMATIWGSIGLIVREVPQPAVVIVWFRVAIASFALGLILIPRRRRADFVPLFRVHTTRTLLQGVCLAAHWVLLFAALRRAPIGTVVLITYSAPLIVAATAPAILRERVGRVTAVALVLGFVGTALVLQPGGDADWVGPIYALAAAVLLAGLIMNAKVLSEHYEGVSLTFMQVFVAAVVLTPVALAGDGSWPDWPSLGWLLVLGLVHTAATLVVYLSCIARLRATHISILGYFEPVSAALLGWVVLDESLGPATLAGAVLVVIGGLLVARSAENDEPVLEAAGGLTVAASPESPARPPQER